MVEPKRSGGRRLTVLTIIIVIVIVSTITIVLAAVSSRSKISDVLNLATETIIAVVGALGTPTAAVMLLRMMLRWTRQIQHNHQQKYTPIKVVFASRSGLRLERKVLRLRFPDNVAALRVRTGKWVMLMTFQKQPADNSRAQEN
jgi:hypothetical protein